MLNRFIKKSVLTLALLLSFAGTAKLTTVSAEAAATGTVYVTGTQRYDLSEKMLKLINRERTRRGLGALEMDQSLTNAAMQRSAELTVYIPTSAPHKRPNGKNANTANKKISYEICAESAGAASCESVLYAWMNFSSHRAGILLRSAKSAGVSCYIVGNNYYWTVEFGNGAGSGVSATGQKVMTKSVQASKSYLKASNFSLTGGGTLKKGSQSTLQMMYRGSSYFNRQLPAVPILARSFKWKSSKSSVASVSANGVVKAKKPGVVTITAQLKTGSKAKKSVKIRVVN